MLDELAYLKAKKAQQLAISQLAEKANVRSLKLVPEVDYTEAVKRAYATGKVLYFPKLNDDEKYIISDTIVCSGNLYLTGDGMDKTYIESRVTGNKHLFQVENATFGMGVIASDISIYGLGATATDGYAFFVKNSIVSNFYNCRIRQFGGGAIYTNGASTTNICGCLFSNNGNNPYYQGTNYGVIHAPRENGLWQNGLNVSDCYISNNIQMSGIKAYGTALHVSNTTIESGQILLDIGDTSYQSTGITLNGCYFENPYVGDIRLTNCKDVFVSGTYAFDSGNGGGGEYSIYLNGAVSNALFAGCEIGSSKIKATKGINYDTVNFISCENVFFKEEYPMLSEKSKPDGYYNNLRHAMGGYGKLENRVAFSDDLTQWSNNGCAVVNDAFFNDGSVASTVTKTGGASSDIYVSISSLLTGEQVCASFYISESSAGVKLRARRSSDNTFEDITVNMTVVSGNGEWKRFYVNHTALKDYNLVHLRISPGSYSAEVGATCKISRVNIEKGRLFPSVAVKTNGSAMILPNLAGVTNGHHYVVKKALAVEGIGVGNSVNATTLGAVAKKMEVFDASGNSIGFVPIYASIT